ncbi:N-acetylmuramic acid 6-phosphate etherase [Planotetraspora kaengkrachanensis]|uniref:N-acetylmuramic acid 6-phosphate etherase n=1 Tax=Planotetraspora kaengkrachanensis TaxID=575193 RepID=A0A8J3LW14_9ACTN|nr:N-acetylmuramic acid 6-phosphate etherase [Planotetraspora kaengkrachanensis]GIG77548.1 N-acetylmuramic acid 6-phosphate etherase [Planotetraspora kaengkrachanensis]
MTDSELEAVKVAAPTEGANPRTRDIDLRSTLDMLRLINDEDRLVAPAVRAALPELAKAVDLGVSALMAGRSIHYFGAGSSGRIAVLDAAELLPTYTIDPRQFVAHHAGGLAAFEQAMENVEDDEATGAAEALGLGAGDLAIGLSASGRTPYVAGALRAAGAAGAATVLVSSNPPAPLGEQVDVHVAVATGPEVIAGSTRMKAGTAQKLVLNTFSTAVMIRLGRTYSNLMTDVTATNAKLRGRLVTILEEATGRTEEQCARTLTAAEGDLKVALVCLLADAPVGEARIALQAAGGGVRAALADLATSRKEVS